LAPELGLSRGAIDTAVGIYGNALLKAGPSVLKDDRDSPDVISFVRRVASASPLGGAMNKPDPSRALNDVSPTLHIERG
jgi:hypothetical protein